MCRTYTVQHLAPEEEIPGLELLPKVLTEQTLALRFPGRICKTMHQCMYIILHTRLSILSAEYLAHTHGLCAQNNFQLLFIGFHFSTLLHGRCNLLMRVLWDCWGTENCK